MKDAKEFRENKGIGTGTNITTSMLDSMMESYHQLKSAEEAEERYGKAKREYEDSPIRYMVWPYDDVIDFILHIASGKDKL